MLRRWTSPAVRQIPPKIKRIRNAKSGVELLLEPLPPVLVGGGVVDDPGTAVSPRKDSNGVCEGSTLGVAVSPRKNSNGVSVGATVGGGPDRDPDRKSTRLHTSHA